jgi:hypothetical protein
MADAPKKGILSRLFGGKKSCCCNVTIEEVTEEQSKAPVETGRNSSGEAIEEQPKTPENKQHNRR